jgi:hypothetical protein
MSVRIPTGPKFQARRLSLNIVDDNFGNNISLPPLFMNVNPQNLKHSFKKKTNRIQTIGGNVEQYWGEELDTISVTGSTGGFVHPEAGYTTVERSKTSAYFKFQDILNIYKNNGNIYDNNGLVIKRGNVILYFDPGTYIGFFSDFEWSENAETPFSFNFSFNFKVERSVTSLKI